MNTSAFYVIFFTFLRVVIALSQDTKKALPVSVNCSSGSQPCGPAPNCCPSGFNCNFNRGIPVCYYPGEPSLSGFDEDPCADPNYFRCDEVLGIPGSCCPIGTICRIHGESTTAQCVDAFGETQASIPSGTISVPIPSATTIQDDAIQFTPSGSWTVSKNNISCGSSESLHSTSAINASISVDYTGPSVRLYTVTSTSGGIFSIIVDGFNTTSTVDTFVEDGAESSPDCYPLQYPPFAVTPPGYASRDTHNMTLVYLGPSSRMKNFTTRVSVIFGSFAIPHNDLGADTKHTNGRQEERSPVFAILAHVVPLLLLWIAMC